MFLDEDQSVGADWSRGVSLESSVHHICRKPHRRRNGIDRSQPNQKNRLKQNILIQRKQPSIRTRKRGGTRDGANKSNEILH